MENTYPVWLELFSEHENLLKELESHLKIEKKALLANDIHLLKEASLHKDKVLRQLNSFQDKLEIAQKKFAQSLGKSHIKLSALIRTFAIIEEQRVLERKRQTLVRLSRSIHTLNSFNQNCLQTYLDQVNTMQSLIALVTRQDQTYSAGGYTKKNKAGNLINRSF